MNRSTRYALFATVALLLAVACGEEEGANQAPGNNDDNELPGGPCVEEYEEPIVLITGVFEANTTIAIAEVEISEIEVHGGSVQHFGATENLTEGEGEVYLCEVPCGFGTEPGEYTFTVEADGYEAAEVTVEAEYEEFVGGCPSFNDGGTEVEVELTLSAPDPE